MREPYSVEADVEATTIKIRKPPALRHYQPFIVFGTLSTAVGLYGFTSPYPLEYGLPIAVVLYAIATVIYKKTPHEHYTVKLSASRIEVDGRAFDIGSLSMILTDEKIVFRDREQQAELWHGIPRLRERMKLRSLLEDAVDNARRRHGRGSQEVPEHLLGVSREEP